MKAQQLETPFAHLVGYVQVLPNGRTYIYMWDRETNQRRLISRARYNLSVELGRILLPEEQVDHKDGDFTNDHPSNLQILSVIENNRKAIFEQGRTMKPITVVCPQCFEEFTRDRRQLITKLNRGKQPCCSRVCGGKYGHTSR